MNTQGFRVLAIIGLCLQIELTKTMHVAAGEPDAMAILPEVKAYLNQRRTEFDLIPEERKAHLKEVAAYVARCVRRREPARITFICTHNSRRSHLCQIWASVAVCDQEISLVESFSGGTESTAFNPRAVACIKRAGLQVVAITDDENPRYSVRFKTGGEALTCFSKVYDAEPNPRENFCAVMTCTQADDSCPVVKGSSLRVAIPYDDPKIADHTPQESAMYDERCAQVSREMLFLFSHVGK